MSLIPVGVQFVHSITPYNSADAPLFVAGTDGLDYVAKLPSPENPCLAASEAISYYLCQRLGMAVPATAWIEFDDGRWAFGSRWECGTQQFTTLDAESRVNAIISCAGQIMRFCLLDAFLGNPDRHADNLLFRRSPLDGRWTVINMDFSRALWRGGFPECSTSSIFTTGNTSSMVQLVRSFGGFDAKISAVMVAGLQAITPEQMADFVNQIPASALCKQAASFPEWWSSSHRQVRAQTLLELIK